MDYLYFNGFYECMTIIFVSKVIIVLMTISTSSSVRFMESK
jgi:hypothetical protein